MKIIKRGTPPLNSVLTGHCKNCGTVAEAFESELTYRSGNIWKAICPVCDYAMSFFKYKEETTIRSDKSSTPDHGFGDY